MRYKPNALIAKSPQVSSPARQPTSLQSAFTLIELLIAMTILSFIALSVYQNTSQSFVLRENIEQEGDFYNAIRVTLDVLGRDISHIYSPKSEALPGNLGRSTQPQNANPVIQAINNNLEPLAPATPYWGDALNQDGFRPSRFQGEAAKMSFVINSHMRLFKDSPESDFAKIAYALEDDPLAPRNSPGKALVKRVDTTVFIEENSVNSETEIKYTLLTNIKSIEFKYLDGEKDTWFARWDTTGIDHKNIFPSVIEVNLEVFLPNSTEHTFKVSQHYRPELVL
ncbi:MAG: type II secretion system protein GspJ [Bdellovibrionota bacterium]